MASETSISALLQTLTESLHNSDNLSGKVPALLPPEHGISLLDVKNDLLLSYLQNLVFLILLKLRNRKSGLQENDEEALDNSVVKKLVELTVYIERGVLKLESQLKYQIDKVLRAAQDAADSLEANKKSKQAVSIRESHGEEDDTEDSEDGSSDGGIALKESEIDDLQYRPNPSALVRPTFSNAEPEDKKSDEEFYRPPRIQATAMPTTERREKEARKPNKSATLDEFVSTEISAAPLAEPSIGSGIAGVGRRSKSEKERKEEKERRDYEERNYVRLPKESKKERAKKGRQDAGYGGEEWRGLGEGIDRIERLTKRKGQDGRNVLEKSRKRHAEGGAAPSGKTEVGEGFQKRLKTLDGGRRDRGRR